MRDIFFRLKWIPPIVLLSLLLTFIPPLVRESMPQIGRGIGAGLWLAKGNWTMNGGPPDRENTWNLTHPQDGYLFFLLLDHQLTSRFLTDLWVGGGDLKSGTITDTDYDPSGQISDLSYSTSSGATEFLNVNFHYRLIAGIREKGFFDISIGYLYLKDSVSYSDPRIVIDNYQPADIRWQETWNVYDHSHRGIRIGLRNEIPLLGNFFLRGTVGYIPELIDDYDGVRYPSRISSQPEKIKARGKSFDYDIRVGYSPIESLLLIIGYRYLDFKAKGRDAESTPWAGSWEDLESTYKGIYFYGTYKF